MFKPRATTVAQSPRRVRGMPPRRPVAPVASQPSPLHKLPPVVALPFEYDEYYNTRVARPWSYIYAPILIGSLLIVFGIFSLIFSCIDFADSAVMMPYYNNPNYANVLLPQIESPNLAATWQGNAFWPTLGKGFWVGLLMIATGILAIVSRFDGSFVGVYVFNILAWTCALFSLFQMLSAIMQIQVYPYNRVFSRNYRQNLELGMNCLLLILGIFSFIVSVIGAIKSCIYMDYCSNGRIYPKYGRYGPVAT